MFSQQAERGIFQYFIRNGQEYDSSDKGISVSIVRYGMRRWRAASSARMRPDEEQYRIFCVTGIKSRGEQMDAS